MMKSIPKIPIIILLWLTVYLCPSAAFAGDLEKANEYYNTLNYKFAIELYEKVMAKKPSLSVAQKLANCYRFINNTEAAELAYAKVISFDGFAPINFYYYADVLKQNGKYDLAKYNYTMYGTSFKDKAAEAANLAASCDSAKNWAGIELPNILVKNQSGQNTEFSEFSPTLYDKGFTFVSDRLNADDAGTIDNGKVYGWTGNGYLKIYEVDTSNANELMIKKLPESINSKFHNGPATFSSDMNWVYFSRTDINEATKGKKLRVGQKYIYYSEKKNGVWSEAELLPFNKSEKFNVQHPTLSSQGDILYFSSDMPGGFGGADLYASRKNSDGTWGKPENCGSTVNTSFDEVFPYVRADGKLYFSSKGHIGLGGLDLFSADGSYNSFSSIQNLRAPFNSSKDDFGVLFFDDLTGLLSSNRNGGSGLDDIYRFSPLAPVAAAPVLVIQGKVIDHLGAPVKNAVVTLFNNTLGTNSAVFADANGLFNFNLEPETDYRVHGDSKMIFDVQDHTVSTVGVNKSTTNYLTFTLRKPLDTKDVYALKNIYYDFNKYNLRKDALVTLFKLAVYLKKYPNVNIELRSHTDERGTPEYNIALSQKRADAVVEYLKYKGISADRLTAKGYGETELIFVCGDNKCSEAKHQLNRRSEFKVLNK